MAVFSFIGRIALLGVSFICLGCTRTDIESGPLVHPIFSNQMVIQRNQPNIIWGWANPGTRITVDFAGKNYTAKTAKNGRWKLSLKPQQAGGPYNLEISTKNKDIRLRNILIGEVWLCSGQSNMFWPLSRSSNANEDIANSKNLQLRIFTVRRTYAERPLPLFNKASRWYVAGPNSVRDFSAVCYHFGLQLQKSLDVPIGLIQAASGGTVISAWIPPQSPNSRAKANWRTEPRNQPAALFNGMISPITPYGMRGVVFFQGESDTREPDGYGSALTDMMQGWRKAFAQKLSFQIVQIANYGEPSVFMANSKWARLREEQEKAAKRDPRAQLTVTIDLGESDNIHPSDKRGVGKRIALSALGLNYGWKGEFFSPTYLSHKNLGNLIKIEFDNTGTGLSTRNGGAVVGFAVCSTKRRCKPVRAKINGASVEIVLKNSETPAWLRYGWADNPNVNLYNSAGLPAAPFQINLRQDAR
jgi:sialate O-acetylesterase